MRWKGHSAGICKEHATAPQGVLWSLLLSSALLLRSGVSYGEALGSARGLHSLGPSESDSEVGDTHTPGMEEPQSGHKAPQNLHLDQFHERASSR